MPVPEISVHEDSNTFCSENKIRLSESLIVSSPAAHPMLLEQPDQTQFGRGVPTPPDASHNGRTLNLVESVSHGCNKRRQTKNELPYSRQKVGQIAGQLIEWF
jgi:hypothetical protein